MTQRAVIYGGSLYELAVEENRAAQILEELTEVFKLFRENPDYLTLLLEPSIKKDKRLELIEEAFGSSCDRYLVNFLKLLCERGLLREFEGCRETFIKRYNRDNNISEALVTSAVASSTDSETGSSTFNNPPTTSVAVADASSGMADNDASAS